MQTTFGIRTIGATVVDTSDARVEAVVVVSSTAAATVSSVATFSVPSDEDSPVEEEQAERAIRVIPIAAVERIFLR